MKEKLLKFIFVFMVIACFSISTVAATDFTEHDFDGKFKLNVPSGDEFTKETLEDGWISYEDNSRNLLILYYEDDYINDNTIHEIWEDFEKKTGGYRVGTFGDGVASFTIENDNYFPYASIEHTNGKAVIMWGDDSDILKEVIYSLKF